MCRVLALIFISSNKCFSLIDGLQLKQNIIEMLGNYIFKCNALYQRRSQNTMKIQ